MSKPLIYRQNRFFKIDTSQLSVKANKSYIINALYAAIYDEFKEAVYNKKYEEMNNFQKMQAINEFALNWLKEKGLK